MSGRGRPPTGTRVEVRVPAELLKVVDELARRDGATRAVILRTIIERGAAAITIKDPS